MCRFFDANFPGDPHTLYTEDPARLTAERYRELLTENDAAIAVINGPQRTLSNAYLGDIHDVVRRVLETAEEPRAPDPRSTKPLLAAVRGSGGGKTRLVEELRLALLRREERDVLPLAVTFNASMELTEKEREAVPGARAEVQYALAVVKRLLCVFYGVPLLDLQLVLPGAENQDFARLRTRDAFDVMLLRACVLHIARKMQRIRPSIKTVVVMHDETVWAATVFGQRDVTAPLRTALLNARLHPRPRSDVNANVNVALLVTSLEPEAIQLAQPAGPRRDIRALPFPVLSEHDIGKWWRVPSTDPMCICMRGTRVVAAAREAAAPSRRVSRARHARAGRGAPGRQKRGAQAAVRGVLQNQSQRLVRRRRLLVPESAARSRLPAATRRVGCHDRARRGQERLHQRP